MKKQAPDLTGDLFEFVQRGIAAQKSVDAITGPKARASYARSTDPETAHTAAAKASESARKSKVDRIIVEHLTSCGRRGSTTLEFAQKTGLVHNNVSPRFKPLEEAGYIVRRRLGETDEGATIYEKRKGTTGASSVVWWAKGLMP